MASAATSSHLSLFSQYQTVYDLQMGTREIGTALFEKVRTSPLGSDRTHVYTLLSTFAALVDWKDLPTASTEIKVFVKEIVSPIVSNCFKAIEAANNDLNKIPLIVDLEKKLNAALIYPKKTEFPFKTDDSLNKELASISPIEGTYVLCDIIPESKKFRNSYITISKEIFALMISAFEKAGYKKAAHKISSTAAGIGHITNLTTTELAEHYDKAIEAHEKFTKNSPKAILTIKGVKEGRPQYGRLAHVVMAIFKIDNLEGYRKECGLGEIEFPPCITIFSSEVQPYPQFRGVTLAQFADLTGSTGVSKMVSIMEAYIKQKSQASQTAAASSKVTAAAPISS